jgi:hypothetical protein
MKDGTMSNERPDTERRRRPEGETRIVERSMAHTLATHYVEGVGTGAGIATVALAKETMAAGAAKVTDALKPNESKIELPPGVDRPD